LALAADGVVLGPVAAPAAVGQDGALSFVIQRESGSPVTEFAVAHEKELHLIVVRTDGTQFRHVHPELDRATGTWSLPWRWDAAGTYRVYADFTPAAEGASGVTLSRLVEVAGDYQPVPTQVTRTAETGGFTVAVAGDLTAGAASELTFSVTRDGRPVTALQPYLGAFGHLVALREGDLAYLHVHAGDPSTSSGGGEASSGGGEASSGSGEAIGFSVAAPTAGRYLLYLDFQVDGQVHTAQFVLDATSSIGNGNHDHSHSGGH
ncbi:MAG: hypothetical protein WAW85_07320, partial [Gordonia sp. (in: high G+C Gram-positive bacteria)]|uniref:heavy-metal-associated domain-containing protein n=1 Tax=Gordonia sp. (in: high G+C Gram-positive bacteria) TaxID=84139 RepID=UPI003BB79C5F